ncbi:unnamed protein product [Caretta caretta]
MKDLNRSYYNWLCEEEDEEIFKHNNCMLVAAVTENVRLLLVLTEKLHTMDCHFWARATNTA